MKSDINLLQKRKDQKYSGQKLAMIILLLVLFAGAAYAGITIPASARSAISLVESKIRNDIQSATGDVDNVSELNSEYQLRKQQLDALTAIDMAKSDMSSYLDAVETACPSTINLSYFSASEETMNVLGSAVSDSDIAAFCLRLRESGKFSAVFLTSSTLMEDGSTAFSIELTLPASLDNSAVLPETTDETTEEDGQ